MDATADPGRESDWTPVPTTDGTVAEVRGYVVGGATAITDALRDPSDDRLAALRGSFLIRVTDPERTRWITDRTGSRRAFLDGAGISLDPRPAGEAALDLGAIGCVLVNGYPLSGRTLHRDVRALEPSSVTTVEDGAVASRPYWTYRPSGEDGFTEEQARSELSRALLDAVDAHVPDATRMSLSAGYDARGILGILRYRLGRREVHTFSYAHGTPAAGSDAALAATLATDAGYGHRVLESVDPDLRALIAANARLAHGLANICDEVRVWDRDLERDLPVVVGDESFGWNDVPLRDTTDVLESVYLHRGEALRGLRRFVGADLHDALATATNAIVDEAAAPHLDRADLHDAKDSLYFAERLRRGLMAWRESFAGDGRQVINPLLDGPVLDVVARMPSSMRRGKALYRQVIRDLVPEVFEVPFARTMGYSPDWRADLLGQQTALLDTLGTPSRLDAVIPPEAIERLFVRAGTRRSQARERVEQVGASLRARPAPFEQLGGAIGWQVSDPTLLRRLLVLRSALSD